MKIATVFILAIFCCLILEAQKQNYNWYFGRNAGVTFHNSPPKALMDGALRTSEGCASMSDYAGKLLFYTDGISVYNRFHELMPNGSGLTGNSSSTQSGVILKHPGSNDLYVVFSVDDKGSTNEGLQYSILDMRLDNGKGDIVSGKKSILLIKPTAEKLAATNHQNENDIWVVSHGRTNDIFHVFLLTDNGISKHSTQTLGSINNDERGYMKFSPNGDMLAVAHSLTLDLFSFNKKTGVLTYLYPIHEPGGVYGLEFSPDGRYLYYANRSFGNLYQYDLSTKSSVTVTTEVPLGALQIAPDGKIYVAQKSSKFLGVIHSPEKAFPDCKYEANHISLERECMEGLPNFLTINPYYDFSAEHFCFGSLTKFNLAIESPTAHYKWIFNDPGALHDTSVESSPVHIFSEPGEYLITLIITEKNKPDTVRKKITITEGPENVPVNNFVICKGVPVELDAGNEGAQYLWSTGQTSRKIKVAKGGSYSVHIRKGDCEIDDTLQVNEQEAVQLNLGTDLVFCKETTVSLDAGPGGDAYLWSTKENTQTITVSRPGAYWVVKALKACSATDSIKIEVQPLTISKDTGYTVCGEDGGTLDLDPGPGTHFIWEPGGETTRNIIVNKANTYTVNFISPDSCIHSTSFVVKAKCPPSFYIPSVFVPGSHLEANATFKPVSSYIFAFQMDVFNRWGECMFSSEDAAKGWDGTYRGKMCPDGVYFYIIKYGYLEKEKKEFKHLTGSFTLLR